AEQAKKEEIEDRLGSEAMKNKYTKLLLDNMLLNSYEMTDTAIMAGFQQHVFPLYVELNDFHGLNAVQDHLT
ncbi:RepB protein, partial [Enterococcus faecalis]